MRRFRTLGLAIAILSCLNAGLPACDVPVFRYALEFWNAAPYEAVIVHEGALSAAQQKQMEKMQQIAADQSKLNLIVREADLKDAANAELQKTWADAGSPALPAMIVKYPAELKIEDLVWSGAFDEKIIPQLISSPAREEIVKRTMAGQSSVFVLLECGNAAKDGEAKELLSQKLASLEKTLRLPEAAVEALKAQKADDVEPNPPLRVQFSVLTVSRKDPAEAMFVQMLLHSEPDLAKFNDEPLVFPIYGRGRILYALVGKGIDGDNIHEACNFLVGACSCEAKEENPGTDLLMDMAWDSVLKGSVATEVGQPPLTGLQTLAKSVRSETRPADEATSATAMPSSPAEIGGNPLDASMRSPLMRNIMIAGLVVLAASISLMMLIVRKTGRPQ